jgi:deoxycytidine triphosphate deaminase
MYLADNELKELLPQLDIECSTLSRPFSDNQVQPASIDLRLSPVIWVPKKHRVLDLLREKAIQHSPHRFWTKKELLETEYIELKPGETILARVYEKLTIPNTCAGKFEGRSSFARLGLSVHATGDFANPGYRGHMPLQLINHGPFTLRVYPYISVCQLILVKLSSESRRKYGADDLTSKYTNDIGGPSYWWRDKYIRELQELLDTQSVSEQIKTKIYASIADVDAAHIERLNDYLHKHTFVHQEDAFSVLRKFAKTESVRKWLYNKLQIGLLTIMGACISLFIAHLAGRSITWQAQIWLMCVFLVALVLECLLVRHIPPPFFTPDEMEKAIRSAGSTD